MNGATSHHRPPVHPAALWFTFLGGPVAWTIRLLASYPLVPVACRLDTTAPLNLITGVTAIVGIAAAVTGWIAYRRLGDRGTDDPDPTLARVRFMALAGILISALFTYSILAEGMAVLLHDPCLRAI